MLSHAAHLAIPCACAAVPPASCGGVAVVHCAHALHQPGQSQTSTGLGWLLGRWLAANAILDFE